MMFTYGMNYSVVNVDEIEPGGPTGSVRFVRRELGVEAFGVNWFEIPANAEGYEHDEATSRQEEIAIVVEGGGHWRVDGEDVPVRRGTVIRFDPDATRQPFAGPEGLTFVAIGARRDGGYEPRGPF